LQALQNERIPKTVIDSLSVLNYSNLIINVNIYVFLPITYT